MTKSSPGQKPNDSGPRCPSSGDAKFDDFIEGFRGHFEARFGVTDWTLKFSFDLPFEEQEVLIAHDPIRFMEGLPPYMKTFLQGMLMQVQRERGTFDELPELLRNYHINIARLRRAG